MAADRAAPVGSGPLRVVAVVIRLLQAPAVGAAWVFAILGATLLAIGGMLFCFAAWLMPQDATLPPFMDEEEGEPWC